MQLKFNKDLRNLAGLFAGNALEDKKYENWLHPALRMLAVPVSPDEKSIGDADYAPLLKVREDTWKDSNIKDRQIRGFRGVREGTETFSGGRSLEAALDETGMQVSADTPVIHLATLIPVSNDGGYRTEFVPEIDMSDFLYRDMDDGQHTNVAVWMVVEDRIFPTPQLVPSDLRGSRTSLRVYDLRQREIELEERSQTQGIYRPSLPSTKKKNTILDRHMFRGDIVGDLPPEMQFYSPQGVGEFVIAAFPFHGYAEYREFQEYRPPRPGFRSGAEFGFLSLYSGRRERPSMLMPDVSEIRQVANPIVYKVHVVGVKHIDKKIVEPVMELIHS